MNENELAIAESTNIHVMNVVTRERNSYCYHKEEITHVMRIDCEKEFVSADRQGRMFKWKREIDMKERKDM